MTPPHPGAVAVVQLFGDVERVLRAMCGDRDWSVGRLSLCDIAGIDEGLAVRLTPTVAQVMPHGGPRVVQRLATALAEHGVTQRDPRDVAPRDLYPEASDDVEALMLATLARAASPMAIDLLLDQPRRWRETGAVTAEDRARSRRLDRLVAPPLVVLVGPANVGKSTLSNTLLGRSMSVTHDMPGTTRDYTSARIDLGGLVVDWVDTPGRRATDDSIEDEAIAIAQTLDARADLVVAVADAQSAWPEVERVDVRVGSRCDLGRRDDVDVSVSAVTGEGLETFVSAVRERLVPASDVAHDGVWVFDRRLLT